MKIENKVFWYYKVQWNTFLYDNVKMYQDWNITNNKIDVIINFSDNLLNKFVHFRELWNLIT